MWKSNKSLSNGELQNHFTGYLLSAIRYKRREYFEKLRSWKEHEITIDEMVYSSAESEDDVFERFSVMHNLDNTTLWKALNQLSDRELYVLLKRVVDEKSFDELAVELGIGYKGAAAIYYRAIKKIRDTMRR